MARLAKKRSRMLSIQRMPFRLWRHSRSRRNAAPAIQSEDKAVFQEIYKKELEGLPIPMEKISYRGKRIGGQDIMPRVLNQLDRPICLFMATTACVEARYRLFLARNQGERQPLWLFEQLAWDSWAPQDFNTIIETKPWTSLLQPIVEQGIAIEREHSNNPLTARRYRVADIKAHPLQPYGRAHVTKEQRAHDWATLRTELQMGGPFVAVFRPSQASLYGDYGEIVFHGSQGADKTTPHAVLVTGCLRFGEERYFEIMNSYGSGWGDKGFGWVNMECLDYTLIPCIVPLGLHH